jgi:hypothetical protein
MASGAAKHAIHGPALLEAAQGDDLLSLLDLEGEGKGSPAEDGVGAIVDGVERGNHTTAPDLDKATVEEITG